MKRILLIPTMCVIASLALAGTALAAPAQSVSGNVRSYDGLLSATFSISRVAGAPSTVVTGSATGRTHPGVVQVAGKATCLDVRGNNIGLAFRFDQSTPEALASVGLAEIIYLTVNDKGEVTALSFVDLPAAAVKGCAPIPGVIPASGRVTVAS